MKADVISLSGGASSSIELDDAIFGLEPRADILHRVVRWQLAKRQAGTHKTQTRSDVSYAYRKIYRQKGTGGARHGSRGVAQFRKGGTTKGPVVRSHAHKLPSKVRRMGLRHALSARAAESRVFVVDELSAGGKTKELSAQLGKLGITKALFIDGAEPNEQFARATRNIPGMDVLPSQGANVYDILSHKTLVLTKAGLAGLEERLK